MVPRAVQPPLWLHGHTTPASVVDWRDSLGRERRRQCHRFGRRRAASARGNVRRAERPSSRTMTAPKRRTPCSMGQRARSSSPAGHGHRCTRSRPARRPRRPRRGHRPRQFGAASAAVVIPARMCAARDRRGVRARWRARGRRSPRHARTRTTRSREPSRSDADVRCAPDAAWRAGPAKPRSAGRGPRREEILVGVLALAHDRTARERGASRPPGSATLPRSRSTASDRLPVAASRLRGAAP